MKIFLKIPFSLNSQIALTIGNFDGVHLGHQAMIRKVCDEGKKRGLRAGIMLFEPQPREFFNKGETPARITSIREKLTQISKTKIDFVFIVKFDMTFSQMPPDVFAEKVLSERLGVRWLLVGDDFKFGAKRTGDFGLLKRLAKDDKCDFTVESMESVRFKGLRVSSTIVRKALAEGNLRVANSMLGRTYSIEGRVSHGDGFGRKINYPTANVKLRRKKVPLFGIYAVSVFLPEKVKLEGVASLGVRPTVKKDGSPLLEVYIFDFDDYIYGKKIKVEFLKKIRDEKKFDSIAEMVRQMDNDANLARRFFKQNEYYQSNKVIMKNGKL